MPDLTEAGRLLLDLERKRVQEMPELSEVGLRKMEEERKAMARAAAEHAPADPEMEIPRLLNSLDRSADRLAENLQQLLMRTAVVSAVDRPLPDAGGANPSEEVQTELGSALQSLLFRLDHLSDQINDRNHQLEI